MNSPVNERNAIETMAFVVAFEHPFSPSTCEGFLGLQEVLADDFPTFNRTMSMEINVKEELAVEKTETLNGIVMQRTLDSGKPAWQLRAQGNNLIASCYHYDRWADESAKAISYLLKMASSVDVDNPVVVVALETVDRFHCDTSDYHVGGVFNAESRFLTKHALESGPLWHVHQGWFDQCNDDRCLNVLNLSTKDTPDGIGTIIDHNTQMIFDSGKSVLHLDSYITNMFEELHDKNKSVVRELLNEEQKNRVGL